MKALLHCAWDEAPRDSTFDPLLTELIDRPFVQHVVEWLVQAGFTEIELLTGRNHEALFRVLQDGTRWGCRIRARRVLGAAAFDLASLYEESAGGLPLLLARADCLPATPAIAASRPEPRADQAPAFFGTGDGGGDRKWLGWAWLTRPSLAGTGRLRSASALQRRFESWSTAHGCDVTVDPVLSVVSPAARLDAQRAVLGGVGGLQIGAREVAAGVWVARGARIAPETAVVPPAFVGEFATVRGGTLGPFAAVAAGAVVSEHAVVADALVERFTYVGPHVELRDCVARGRAVHHANVSGVVTVEERAWLEDLTPATR